MTSDPITELADRATLQRSSAADLVDGYLLGAERQVVAGYQEAQQP